MASLRSFFLFYILLVFTLFNSKWAEKSLNQVPCLPNVNNIHLLDIYEQADMNTKAVPAISKIVKYSACKEVYIEDSFVEGIEYSRNFKLPDILLHIICGVKSFLHLLQLF